MIAEILTIGDELLIGQVTDTNSGWMGEKLNALGIEVTRRTSIRDRKSDIMAALDETLTRSDLVLITGGLGPTKDDITKQTLSEYFGTRLVLNQEVLSRIEDAFRKRGIHLLEENRGQAMLPENCTIIPNLQGTASGMWFEKDNKIVISMPGVPYEMKGMMEQHILPEFSRRFVSGIIVHRTICTVGIGESMLARQIAHWEESLAAHNIRLAYLPSPGTVRLRMTMQGPDENKIKVVIQEREKELQNLIGEYIYGFDTDTLEKKLGEILIKAGKTISIAESCTGGFISHLITSVPGSTQYYKGAIVPYLEKTKMALGLASQENLNTEGAVSSAVAESMVRGIMKLTGSDYALSTTGIAGPAGGSEANPVGTVWIGLGTPRGVKSCQLTFGRDRGRNILMASVKALDLIRKEILSDMAEN
ncbi:MAG: hypothetical protein RL220_41 [Bacteroidota bacterium]